MLSLIAFSIETLPDLSPGMVRALYFFEVVSVVIFSVEYLARLWVAPHRWKFVFSFFGIVDLLAILPFFLSLGVDLRSIRVVRLLRLVRILKLARYNKAIQRFHYAVLIAREEILLFLSAAAILLYLGAVGIYYCECDAQPEAFGSVFHCLWWSLVTLTTVGYGDVYPITVGGRIFTAALLLVGLGIVAVPTGIISSALVRARELEEQQAKLALGNRELLSVDVAPVED
ncbi:voltage-gated potassium channel-like [Blastopirellula marina DSM 3645]|uniref:Voltage-gated potassium channel-like n=1 Tax=Blastopirellula marina DSM 3645 TaxID=314230 RepID=A4A214_9BACT|nr:voltage-gated potassium channel-like [Blastopirellula marina DSM 3645]